MPLQILEEMEKEFGILCPSNLPNDQDKLDVDRRDSALRFTLTSHQEELERAQSSISQMEEEKNKVGVTLKEGSGPWDVFVTMDDKAKL